MALTVVSTNTIGTGVGVKMTVANDEAFILAGVAVVSTNSIALWGTGTGQTFQVAGTVIASEFSTIVMQKADASVVVFSTGLVSNPGSSDGNPAITFAAANGDLYNMGEIVGHDGTEFGTGGATVMNYGTIIATGTPGAFQSGAGIALGSSTGDDMNVNRIVNHGSIAGENYAIHSFANAFHGHHTLDIVKNFGTLTGTVDLGARNDKLINAGLITGEVSLGGGDDIYRGKGEGIATEAVFGGGGRDLLDGGKADDTLAGDSGNDTLLGRDGDDILLGGAGRDAINGGRGDDILTGNSGNDRFIFKLVAGDDTITDFKPGNDKVDLTAYGLTGFSVGTDTVAGFWLDLDDLGGSGSILFEGVFLADFAAGDFLL